MRDNTAAREDSPDSQLDLGSPCIGNSKKGLDLRIALIFTHHFYFKGIATKAYVADYGILKPCGKSLLCLFNLI